VRTRQSGTTLVIVLIMLVVVTLLGVASMRISNSSLQVVGNMQARKFVENWSFQAIEQTMNSIAPYASSTAALTPITSSTTASGTDPFVIYGVPNGVTITVGPRTCIYTTVAAGYSAVSTIAPEDNLWEFRVTVTDNFTKATTAMVQGVKIRQLFNSCPT
jgi:Tfp pilus assembly protein PilX